MRFAPTLAQTLEFGIFPAPYVCCKLWQYYEQTCLKFIEIFGGHTGHFVILPGKPV